MDDTPKTRLFAPDLSAGELALPPDEAHHARDVLRLRAGACVEVFDGCGRTATAEVIEVTRKAVRVTAETPVETPPARPRLHLATAVPKGKRLDWLLEKATELAAASIRPVVFERSVAGGAELSENKRARWQGHCVAAAKQSGLNHLPDLRDPQPIDAFLTQAARPMILGDPAGATSLDDSLPADVAEITLLVGPEGGLIEAETRACRQADAIGYRLGETTLRIETAAVALLAVVRAWGQEQHD